MKKGFLGALIAILFLFALTGCGGGSPSSTVRDFYNYTQKGDYEKAASLLSQSTLDQFGIAKIVQLLQQQKEGWNDYGGVDKFEIADETVVNNQAMVEVKITMKDGQVLSDTVTLLKEEKGWRINLGK